MAIRLGISLFLLSFLVSINLCGQAIFDTIFRPESLQSGATLRYAVDFDTTGNAWVSFFTNGLGKYNVQTNEWTIYPVDGDLPDYPIQFLAVSYDKVWLIMRDGNAPNVLFFFDGNTFTDYTPLLNGLTVNDMVSSKFDGKVYILTNQGILQPATNEIWNTQNSGLPNDTVYDLTEETPNRIWIGTRNGLAKKEANTWTTYNTSNLNITSNQITDVEATNGNGVWFRASSNTQNGFYRFQNGQLSNNYLSSVDDHLSELIDFSFENLIQTNQNEVAGFNYDKLFYIKNESLETQCITNDYDNSVYGPNKVKYNSREDKFWFMPLLGEALLIHYNGEPFYVPGGNQTRNISNLTINQMDIAFSNRGRMYTFDSNNGSQPKFEVPKGSGKIANRIGVPWIGAYDQNDKLYVSAFTYDEEEIIYQPGPLDTTNCSTNETELLKFDRLWNLNRWHIEEFQYHYEQGNVQNGSYVPHPDILSWPAHGTPGTNQARNLARFVDVNNNGIYNPIEEGDYPFLFGDQTIFTIFNDSSAQSTTWERPNLGLEIHQYIYAFTCPEITTEDSILNYSHFIHYDIYNRSNRNYQKAVFGIFQVPFLGSFQTYVGSSPEDNLVYFYTPDTTANSPLEYGPNPPILSTIVLDGPLAAPSDSIDNDNNGIIDELGEKNLLSYFRFFGGKSVSYQGAPYIGTHFYNYLTTKWRGGENFIYGGSGFGSGPTTNHAYPSWPFENDPDSWSELGIGNEAFGRNTVLSSGPFNLAAGEKVSLDYAWVFNRNLNYEFNSEPYFLQVESNANIVRNWFEQQNYPTCFDWNLSTPNQKKFENKILVYPNPTQNEVRISWTNTNAMNTSISVCDLQGKMIKQIQVNNQSELLLSTQEIPDGFYLVSVCNESGCVTSKLAVMR
jgi:hypothetical protein